MSQAPDRPSQFQIDEAYKQVKLNTRQKAIDYAFMLANANQTVVTASNLLSDAQLIEDYLLRDIDTPQEMPKPTIVPAKEVPLPPRDYRK